MTALRVVHATVRRIFSVGPATVPSDNRTGTSAAGPFPLPLSGDLRRDTDGCRASITTYIYPLGFYRLIIAIIHSLSRIFCCFCLKNLLFLEAAEKVHKIPARPCRGRCDNGKINISFLQGFYRQFHGFCQKGVLL